MDELIRRGLQRAFTPPPMPPEAFPVGSKLVPGVRPALTVAWEAMFYQTLTTGVILGAVGVIALIVAVMLRANLTAHLKGMAVHALTPPPR